MSEPDTSSIDRASYNAGVMAVLAVARAAALRLQMADRPPQTRRDFAINALLGVAEDGAALLIGRDGRHAGAPDEVVFESAERRA